MYVVPKTEFTCSGGYKYSWCTKYKKVNIEIIAYNLNKASGIYNVSDNTYICQIHDYHEYDNIGYTFEGYYNSHDNKDCYPINHIESYIKNKDYINRKKILIPMGIGIFIIMEGVVFVLGYLISNVLLLFGIDIDYKKDNNYVRTPTNEDDIEKNITEVVAHKIVPLNVTSYTYTEK